MVPQRWPLGGTHWRSSVQMAHVAGGSGVSACWLAHVRQLHAGICPGVQTALDYATAEAVGALAKVGRLGWSCLALARRRHRSSFRIYANSQVASSSGR